MTRSCKTWVVACALLLLSGCNFGEFREFTSVEGRFKVWMPTPRESSQQAAGVTMKLYMYETIDWSCGVGYADVPVFAHESEAQIQARLTAARDGAINNIHAKLTSSSHITLQGKYPGREVLATLPDQKGIVRARIYMVGRRLYIVMFLGAETRVESPDGKKFLDSFVVTD